MITSSVVIGLVSTVVTGVLKLMFARSQMNKELREMELQALNARAKINKEVREYENKGFQYTRRFIAILTTICVIAIPFFAVLWYQWMYPIDIIAGQMYPSVWFGWNEVKSGFWPFTSDSTVTVWREFKGLVITPWHTDMFAWIMGMYFGTRFDVNKK